MRKIMMFAGALAIMAVAACQKEQQNPVQESSTTLRFGIGKETKATHTDAVEMVWADGDAISVNTPTGFKTFNLVGGQGTANGTFRINEVVTVNSNATAVYPATLSPTWADDKLKVTLPATYAWSDHGIQAPMISWVNNAYPYFHLLGAVIKVDVYDIPAAANKLVFTTVSQNVSGEFILNASNGIETAAGSNNTITITFDAGSSANKTFYVPVPEGTYTNCTFSVQSATETFKTVKAASITVEKDQLFFAPALSCETLAATTVWAGPIDCSNWGWNQKNDLPLTMVHSGDRLRFHLTEGSTTYWQVRASYAADADWHWADMPTIGLASGQTMADVILTEDVASCLRARNSLVVTGYGVTVNSVEYIPAVEQILWEGSHSLGDWDNAFNYQGLNSAALWAGLKAGKELDVYFEESTLPAINYCQFFIQKASDWSSNIDGLSFDAGTNTNQKVMAFPLTAAQVTAIKESGIVICGKKITITKITLR